MVELPKWPKREDFEEQNLPDNSEALWFKFDRQSYELARAAYWEARARLAVEALEFCRANIANPAMHGSIHGRVFNALHDIGPLPEKQP